MKTLITLASAMLLVAQAFRPAYAGLKPRATLAQTAQIDARWQPWLGCWTQAGSAADTLASPPTAGRLVCVVPTAGTSAVDIVTVADRRIASREHVEATGARRTSERDGCTGWESAEWSSDGRRVYLLSEYDCAGGVKRSTTGLIAMTLKGEWLNITGVAVRENTGVRVLRHRPAATPSGLPEEMASALEGKALAVDTARVAAAAPIGNAAIVDASRHVNAAVVEAWLGESGQKFTVNGKRLIELADAGVADRVVDILVALSYPEVFSIKPSPTAVGELATTDPPAGIQSGIIGTESPLGCGSYSNGLSLYGFDGCSPYGYGFYGARYGYSPYNNYLGYEDYGYYGGYGGWYLATQPAIALISPLDNSSSTHGQVVNGRGYVQGDSSGSSGSIGGSSTSSGSSGDTSGAASSGGGGDRTAHPR